jgi:hypothetical protein
VTDPLLGAARDLLGKSLAGMRHAIEGAPADALNRRPAGEDTNPIAVLTVHALHSTRWWLSVATDSARPHRDRPAEFEASAADAAELLAQVDTIGGECRALLDGGGPFDAGAERVSAPPYGEPETVTAGWALLHALEHLREHVAQLQLTRQVLDRAGA